MGKSSVVNVSWRWSYVQGNNSRLFEIILQVLQTEFTWIERPWNRKYILAPVRDQGSEGTRYIVQSIYHLPKFQY